MEGIFNKGIYWHVVTATLFQGGAIAMGLAIIARLLLPAGWTVRGMDVRLANGTMVALLAVWNLLFGALAAATGVWMTWGYEATTSISLTINKEMFATFALLSLVLMVGMRIRYGPGVWNDLSLKAAYAALGFIAAWSAIVNGSLGGEASLLGTILEKLWGLIGVVPRYPMILPTVGGIVLVVIALVGVGLAVVVRRSRGGQVAPKPSSGVSTPTATPSSR